MDIGKTFVFFGHASAERSYIQMDTGNMNGEITISRLTENNEHER